MTTLHWLRETSAVLFTALLALGFAVPVVVGLGILMPSAQSLYTVALAQGFEAVGKQLRRSVGDA